MLPFVSEKGSDLRPPEQESRPVQHETTSYYKIITVNHPAIMSTAKKASAVSSKKQAVADDNLKKFYLELAHRLCSPPENPESENAWLWKLHTTSQRMSRLFTTLNEHAAFDQVTTIHRACGYFLMKNDVPQKERRQVIEVLASWSALFVGMMQARQYIVPMQEELIRRIREIRRLASPPEKTPLPESLSRQGQEPKPKPTPLPIPARNRPARKTPARVIPAGASAGFCTPGPGRKTAQARGSYRHALPRGKGELARRILRKHAKTGFEYRTRQKWLSSRKRSEHGNRPDDRTDRPA